MTNMLIRLVEIRGNISGLRKKRPGFSLEGKASSRRTQGAIEYIVILASLGLILVGVAGAMPFDGPFMTHVHDALEGFFAVAVGKMVPQ